MRAHMRNQSYRSTYIRRDVAVGQGPGATPRNICLTPRGLTVEAAADQWLTSCAAKYKRSTYSMYRSLVETHVKKDLGSIMVKDLTNEQITLYLNVKMFGGEGQPPLAPSTVCGIITVLRAVFRCAERRGYRVAAWDALNRPRRRARETSTLTEQEQCQLEAHLWENTDTEKLGVLLCLYTGLRIGEVCALKWGDISPEGVLSVRRTVQRIQNPDYGKPGEPRTIIVFDTPKSDSSQRSIPIPSVLQEVLERFRCSPECYVLTGKESNFREPRTLQNHFKAMLKRAGVRDINFHALRHTFATNCVQLGFDPKTLSKILGHSTVGITLDTYVHPSISVMRNLMERLSAPPRSEALTSPRL